MKVILFVGHNGVLGQDFGARYAKEYTVVGVSRRPSVNASAIGIEADIAKCSIGRLLSSVHEIYGQIDHVVYAASSDRGEKLGQMNDLYIRQSVDSNVVGPLRLINGLTNYWGPKERLGKTFTIVSSHSGESVFSNNQAVYGPTKAAQNMMVLQMAQHLSPVRANALCPNSFPSPSLSVQQVSEEIMWCIAETTVTGQLIMMGPDNKNPLALRLKYVR